MAIRPLSKKLVYALGAVLDIAYNGGPGPVQSGDIGARQGIPRRYLEQVMQQLVRAGLLKGVRGPRGGYRLARERRRISLGDIARVVAEVENQDDPLEGLCGSPLCEEVLRPVCTEMRDGMLEQLDAISIEDLCRRARSAEVERAGADGPRFTI
jgi:Rrf2 family protein